MMRLSLLILCACGLVLPRAAAVDAGIGTDPLTFDFGSARVGSPVTHAFTLKNDDAEPLAVLKVRPSCDCLHILSYPSEIRPKSSTEIVVRLVPDKIGEVQYRVFVESSDQKAPVRQYILQGTVTPSKSDGERANDLTGIDPRLFTRGVTKRDVSCYITFDAAQEEMREKNGDMVLIDVRKPEDFAALHIPGSLNIPLFALRAKSFLRARRIALVDHGYGNEALERTCRELRLGGFGAVHILYGGLNVWHRRGGALEGDADAISELSLIHPRDFFPARKYDDWLVVELVNSEKAPSQNRLLPESITLPISADSRDFAGRVGALIAERAGPVSVLVVDSDGQSYAQSRNRLDANKDANIFYLAGGLREYEEHLHELTAVGEGNVQTIAATVGVSRQTKIPIKKPCGGCP